MTARDELLAHAARIESGDLTWVPHSPVLPTNCCVGYVGTAGSKTIGENAGGGALDQEAQARGVCDFVVWNDEHCRSAAEAVEFIRAAAARCTA